MATFLYRLGSRAYRTAWPFLAFWLALLIGVGVLAGVFGKTPSSNFSMPGLDSVAAPTVPPGRFWPFGSRC